MSKASSGGGASVGGGTAAGATSAAAGTHNIPLPKDRRRVTIDTATEAVKQMGGRIDQSSYKFDFGSKQSTYSVKLPNGSTQRMTIRQITDLIYKGKRQ